MLIAIVLAGSHARAQGTRDTLILNLDKALEIALSDNPTIKVAEEEIALKKVSRKETWQNLLPEASITGSMSHTITAPQFSIGDQIVKMGQDKANTAAGTLNISLPLFAPSVYRAMSMTKTDIELAVEKSRASKLDLVNQVTKAYYQLMLSQDSYEVLQKSYELAEENYNIVNAKYQQGAVSEFDKITAEVQMRSVKPSVISAGNAVTLSKLQLKVLMGVTADVEIKIDDSLAAYESIVFANQLENDAHEAFGEQYYHEAIGVKPSDASEEYQVLAHQLHADDRIGVFLSVPVHEQRQLEHLRLPLQRQLFAGIQSEYSFI